MIALSHLFFSSATSSHQVVILHTSNIIIAELDPISVVPFLDPHQVTELVGCLCLGSPVDRPCILGMLVPEAENFCSHSLVLQYRHYRSNPNFQSVEVDDHILVEEVVIVVIDRKALLLRNRTRNYCSALEILYALVHQVLSKVPLEVRIDHLDLVL